MNNEVGIQALSRVIVRQSGTGSSFIELSDIPQPWRTQFETALRGSGAPAPGPDGHRAWAQDWEAWLSGKWAGRPGPVAVLVIDLECTCADDGSITSEDSEIIEIGAVWATLEGFILDRFEALVKPVERPHLTPFCVALTGIEQAGVDSAQTFPAVAAELAEFAQRYISIAQCWASWGAADKRQIDRERVHHGIIDPLLGLAHENLKADFAKSRKIKRVGMKMALEIVGLPLEGTHHRALSDAENVAKLLPWSNLTRNQRE